MMLGVVIRQKKGIGAMGVGRGTMSEHGPAVESRLPLSRRARPLEKGKPISQRFCYQTVLIVAGLLGSAADAATQYTVTDLGTLGWGFSEAHSVNSNGQVVGYAAPASGYHAFVYTGNGPMQDLGILGGDYSYAESINNNGPPCA